MVIVAQLAEQRIVVPRVAGSSPVIHPTFTMIYMKTVIILLIAWYVGLQLVVKHAEIQSEKIREEREKQRQRALQEREAWLKQYNRW